MHPRTRVRVSSSDMFCEANLMTWDRESLLSYLRDKAISYREVRHEAVFTMTDSALLPLTLPGTRCKNLLVQDKKATSRFLIVTFPNAVVDLGSLGRALNVGRLSLCPPDEMQGLLGVGPGSLSPLALVADSDRQIQLVIDRGLRDKVFFLFHPFVNTATVSIESTEFLRFLQTTGCIPHWVDLPRRAVS